MAKETIDKNVSLIKKLIKAKKLIIGTERTIKTLRSGNSDKVFLASNCTPQVESDIKYYSKLADASVVKLSYPNDELGIICKKPFSISVISTAKEESK